MWQFFSLCWKQPLTRKGTKAWLLIDLIDSIDFGVRVFFSKMLVDTISVEAGRVKIEGGTISSMALSLIVALAMVPLLFTALLHNLSWYKIMKTAGRR